MKNNEKQPTKWKAFWQLIIDRRPARWIILVAVLLGIGETVLALLVPLLTMELVNVVTVSNLQANTIVLLVSVFLSQAVMSGFSMYMMTYVGQYIIARLREELWQYVLMLPVPFFDQKSSGETMSRLTNDTNVIKDFITMQVIPFFSGIISIIGSLLLLFIIDWKITLLLLIAVPVALIILLPLGARMFAISRSMQDETAHFQGDLGRVLADIRLVKASIAEHDEEKKGKNRIAQLFTYGMREAKIQSVVSPVMTTIMLLMLVVLIGYGGVRVSAGTLSAGALVAIILYMFQIIVPFTQMASFFTQFQKAMGASERIKEIFNEAAEEKGQKQSTVAIPFSPSSNLRFEDISFRYSDEQDILQAVSFHANAGEMTAFVGPSGAGKTTIFSLIEQFYQPTDGAIYYGDHAIHQLPLELWRKRIAYVSQESPMMAGTIRDNITYGLTNVDQTIIQSAIEQANLTDFIDSLPDGYETAVGERGVKLSGGQRQRLAIARAIIRNPELLLLDEATAHLDSASEKLVQEALQRLMIGRTTLLIAHRLSTVRNADKLIVLEKGHITGEGTHEDLYQKHEFYRTLVEQQFVDTRG